MSKRNKVHTEGLSKVVRWAYVGTKIVCSGVVTSDSTINPGHVINDKSKQGR